MPSIGPFGPQFTHSFVVLDGVKENCTMDDGYMEKCIMNGYIQNRLMGFPRLVIVYIALNETAKVQFTNLVNKIDNI